MLSGSVKGIKLEAIMYSLEFGPYLQRPEGQAASYTGWSLPRVLPCQKTTSEEEFGLIIIIEI